MISEIRNAVSTSLDLSEEETDYFVINEKIDNKAYSSAAESIKILFKDGTVKDAATASDHLNLRTLSQAVEKHFVCYPVNG